MTYERLGFTVPEYNQFQEWIDNDGVSMISGPNERLIACHHEDVSEIVDELNRGLRHKRLLEGLKAMVKMYEEVQPAGGYQGVYEEAVDAIAAEEE